MSEPFLGEIRTFGFNFAPQGWAMCNGQVLSIAQNTALFALLGTIYGGDGVQTFALPDLRGRVGIHVGQGPGLSPRDQGEVLGEENVTLSVSEIPTHAHSQTGSTDSETTDRPTAAAAAVGGVYSTNTDHMTAMVQTGAAGGGLPHDNMQPSLVLNFCIALQGIFPSRN